MATISGGRGSHGKIPLAVGASVGLYLDLENINGNDVNNVADKKALH